MGGGKGGVSSPVYTAPAAAPAATEAATLINADEELGTEEEALKKTSKSQGAKSLQIPLGVLGGDATTATTPVGK
jgi:hypothetical protein